MVDFPLISGFIFVDFGFDFLLNLWLYFCVVKWWWLVAGGLRWLSGDG